MSMWAVAGRTEQSRQLAQRLQLGAGMRWRRREWYGLGSERWQAIPWPCEHCEAWLFLWGTWDHYRVLSRGGT